MVLFQVRPWCVWAQGNVDEHNVESTDAEDRFVQECLLRVRLDATEEDCELLVELRFTDAVLVLKESKHE